MEHFERAKEATSQPQRRATKASPTKALAKDRKEAEEALLKIAKEYGVTSGKWMFFPLPEDVDRVWTIVAEGTARGELGSMAKVAADEGKGDRVGRLICVYTRDFSDQEDVKRVLLGLVDKGLVDYGRGARGIYYKCGEYAFAVTPSKLCMLNRCRCVDVRWDRKRERMGFQGKHVFVERYVEEQVTS